MLGTLLTTMRLNSLRFMLQAANAPDWRNDSEGLWGRLIELGGVAGLHTDSDCLLLKDLCTSGIADDAFLRLVDEEIHVRLCPVHSCARVTSFLVQLQILSCA